MDRIRTQSDPWRLFAKLIHGPPARKERRLRCYAHTAEDQAPSDARTHGIVGESRFAAIRPGLASGFELRFGARAGSKRLDVVVEVKLRRFREAREPQDIVFVHFA